MKRVYKFAATILSVLTLSAGVAQAQEQEDIQMWILKIGDGLYSEPQTPNFYTKNKKGNLAIAAGAQVRLINTFDAGGVIKNSMNAGFIAPYIPSSMKGLAKGQYYLSPATSQLYVKGAGMLNNGRTIEAYLSINFMGKNYAPDLYQAYVKLYNFTVGKAWNTMANINAAPPTVDYWGPSGFGGFRNALIRYENWISNSFSYGASIEMPIVDAEYSLTQHEITQCVPDMTGYIQYNWGQDGESTLRLSGVYRYMSYFDDVASKSDYENGYGVQLSGKANITPNLIGYYRAIGGYGIASYINDISTLPADIVNKNGDPGRMTNLGMWGAYVGLQYNICPSIFVSATYSQARMYSRSTVTPSDDTYRYSQYILANCFWNVSKNLQLAAEYIHGIKSDFGGGHYNANRMNLLLQYSF